MAKLRFARSFAAKGGIPEVFPVTPESEALGIEAKAKGPLGPVA